MTGRAGFFRKVFAGLFLIAVSAAVFFLRPLCYLRAPVDEALDVSLREVRSAREGLREAGEKPLRAGWARRGATPDYPLPLAGYGKRRGRESEGIETPLWSRVLALESGGRTVVFAGVDALLIPEDFGMALRRAFAENTGLPEESLFLFATHTHSAPNLWDNRAAALLSGGACRDEYVSMLKDAVLSSAVEALESMEAAQFASGREWAPEYVRNRVRDEPVDAWLEWFAVRKLSGDEFCVLVNYSAHATVLGASNMKVSGDYPGCFSEALESREDVSMALFQAGALGGAGPRAPAGDGGAERARAMGEALALIMDSALSGEIGMRKDAALYTRLIRIELPRFQFAPWGLEFGLSSRAAAILGFDSSAFIHAVRAGDILMAGLPVELSAEISLGLKEEFFSSSGISLWIASNAAGYYGYVSPDELYRARDCEGRLLYESGRMAFLGPHAEYFFRRLLKEFAFSGEKGGL